MKINPSAKFAPSPFAIRPEDETQFQEQNLPFKEVNNTVANRLQKKKKERKDLPQKMFLDNSDPEDKGSIQKNSEQEIVNEGRRQRQVETRREHIQMKHKPKLLLQLDFEDDLELASPVIPSIKLSDQIDERVQIPIEPVARNMNKLNVLDISCSSEPEGETSAKIISLNSPKKVVPMKIEAQAVVQLHDQSITLQFLFRKVAEQQILHCIVRRDKKNHDGIPEYNIYFQKNLKHILTIRKESMCQYAFYLRQSKGYSFTYTKIAVMNSNFFGNTYTLLKNDEPFSKLTVCYETNILGFNGPRKFHVYLPKGLVPFQSLDEAYQDKNWTNSIEKCVNKSAKWSEKASSFILSFKGRALKSSIKNFVITDKKESEDKFYLIFGKAAPDVFNLDIQSPFSLIQGIGVAISSFERKLTCD